MLLEVPPTLWKQFSDLWKRITSLYWALSMSHAPYQALSIYFQAPPSMGFSRQEYWSRWPFPSPGNLSNPGTEPGSPALQADSLPLSHQKSQLALLILWSGHIWFPVYKRRSGNRDSLRSSPSPKVTPKVTQSSWGGMLVPKLLPLSQGFSRLQPHLSTPLLFFLAISLYYPWFHVMNLLFKGNYFLFKKS